jgi:hypothetical protein
MTLVQNADIVYCVAKVIKKSLDLSMRSIYNIHSNTHDKTEDRVLALIPGAPLVITPDCWVNPLLHLSTLTLTGITDLHFGISLRGVEIERILG